MDFDNIVIDWNGDERKKTHFMFLYLDYSKYSMDDF